MRVTLNGVVAADGEMWLYDFFDVPAFSPKTVRDALDNTPEGEELVLEINSGGGSVFAGFEIYSVLRSASRRTVAEVQSLAASAASTAMLGCGEVTASPVAQVMIHLPTLDLEGDRYDHLGAVDILDGITDSILNGYAAKCGARTTRDELRRLMRAETWLTAPEAKGLGLVDRITGEEQLDPAAVLNSCGGGLALRSLAGRPATDYGTLLDRYRDLAARGEAPARPELGIRGAAEAQRETVWNPWVEGFMTRDDAMEAARAALALEKIRFGGIAL